MQKKILILIFAFSILGILNSLYLTYLHYTGEKSTICDQFSSFKCEMVNTSVFSEMTGILGYFGIRIYLPIPMSVIGLGFFALISTISLIILTGKMKKMKKKLTDLLFIMSVMGTLFGLFLMYIQEFVLMAWCLFCLIMDIIIFSTLILSYFLKKSKIR